MMPGGIPRYIKCYDSGPDGTMDRYTVLFTGRGTREWSATSNRWLLTSLAMNEAPFHPQGFGQHVLAAPGKHLGRRIKFRQLPPDCQKLTLCDYRAIWQLN